MRRSTFSYSLTTLLDYYGSDVVPGVSGGVNKDKLAMQLIEKFLKKWESERRSEIVLEDETKRIQFECRADCLVSTVKNLKYPNFVSLNQRPDVLVMMLVDHTPLVYPVLIVEVHSKDGSVKGQSYEHTIIKTVLGMIDQFRYLTNCCKEASSLELAGFVFPSDDSDTCVTEIKLS